MKSASLWSLVLAVLAAPAAATAPLPPLVPVGYVTGLVNAEDMVSLPNTPWVFASSDKTPDKPKPDYLYLIDARTKAARPVQADRAEGSTAGDPTCRPIPFDKLAMSGLGLRRKSDGSYQLMGVNRGTRMSIEFFDIGQPDPVPTVTWAGCLVMPDRAFPNAVVPFGDTGLAVTISFETDNDRFLAEIDRGEPTGYLLTWNPGQGFARVPGGEASLNNGIAVDPDQKHWYIADFGGQSLLRLPIAPGTEPPLRVDLGGRPDNVHWTHSGRLVVAVLLASVPAIFDCAASSDDVCPMPFKIVEVDPKTMKPVRTVVSEPLAEGYGGATAALWVGDELWISSYRNTGIARYASPATARR